MGKTVTFDYSRAAKFISAEEMENAKGTTMYARDVLVNKTGAGNDFLGWIDLPVNYDKEEFARIKKAAEKILVGQFAINPYTENGRSIAPYVQQHQAITGFEANYHLGQARFLEKLDLTDGKRLVGEKLKQAWFKKIREELNR